MAATTTTTHDESVILYPSPGMGHLVSMFELAKILITHGLHITILIVEPHYNTGSTAEFTTKASASNPSILFYKLPQVTSHLSHNSSPHHEAQAFDLLRISNPELRRFLRHESPPPSALIIDFLCGFALDVSAELSIPTYCFGTSGAGVHLSFLHFPELHNRTSASFREMGCELISIPGITPLPANHMPLPLLDRDDEGYKGLLYLSQKLLAMEGFIANTFEDLEPRAVAAASAGEFPPLYCIGPLIQSNREADTKTTTRSSSSSSLDWLDTQPAKSVVFLCFGSIGLFSAEQIKEIASGLEKSGERFLWVVRSPRSSDPEKRFAKPVEPDLDILLPEGFLERTKGRGMVVKSWAPQAEVLKHVATGGFVCHCGWNSVLEAIVSGVPMVAWPLYAEQWMNKVFLVEEMKLAFEMEGYDKEIVTAEEVEKKIRLLMGETEQGRELRVRAERAKERAAAALEEDGKSKAALVDVVGRIKRGK